MVPPFAFVFGLNGGSASRVEGRARGPSATTFLIEDASSDLAVVEGRGAGICQDGSSYDLIGGRQSIEENEGVLLISNSHVSVGECDTGFI